MKGDRYIGIMLPAKPDEWKRAISALRSAGDDELADRFEGMLTAHAELKELNRRKLAHR